MKKDLVKFTSIMLFLIMLLVFSFVQSVRIGVLDIPASDIGKMFYYSLFNIQTKEATALLDSVSFDIVFDLRLPRAIMSAICGASLSLGGVVMQALVRNPLADPYVLGVSSGAALGATAAIILGVFSFLGIYGLSVGAFFGGLVTVFAVFSISFTGVGRASTTKLILAGMAINAICIACTNLIVYLAKDVDGIRNAAFWVMGSMAAASWDHLPLPFIAFVFSAFYFIMQYRVLNASLMGEEMAFIMGINLPAKRKKFLILVSLFISIIVSLTGVIGFVGLVIPHITRIMFGTNHIKVIPFSLLLGAIYMIWCDILARIILGNSELPIGIVTALIGGPFFLYLMMTRKYGFGDK